MPVTRGSDIWKTQTTQDEIFRLNQTKYIWRNKIFFHEQQAQVNWNNFEELQSTKTCLDRNIPMRKISKKLMKTQRKQNLGKNILETEVP